MDKRKIKYFIVGIILYFGIAMVCYFLGFLDLVSVPVCWPLIMWGNAFEGRERIKGLWITGPIPRSHNTRKKDFPVFAITAITKISK